MNTMIIRIKNPDITVDDLFTGLHMAPFMTS